MKIRKLLNNKTGNQKETSKGFTLLEMLLVIAIIAILAGIVIVAINPARQLAQARNAQRTADLNTIDKAIKQYAIDNQGQWPSAISGATEGEAHQICDTGGSNGTCLNLTNDLVPTYISALPQNPNGGNYVLAIDNNQLSLGAPGSTEADLDPVVIGTNSAVLAAAGGSGGNGGSGGPSGVVATCTGCDTDTIDGHTIYTFLGNGTLNVTTGGNVEVLVVAGGGGGGAWGGGGGGAGGLIYEDAYSVSAGSIQVTVGSGGAGAIHNSSQAANGQNSVFDNLISIGGGRGAKGHPPVGACTEGGSGGGGNTESYRDGCSGTPGQGFSGGDSHTSHTSPYNGGGGSGAGGPGVNGTNSNAGNGGPGLEFSISGESLYYAGGGGGGSSDSGSVGSGGLGGGGNGYGQNGGDNKNGLDGFGGGGGGGSVFGSDERARGGDGGSGIVIVRYAN